MNKHIPTLLRASLLVLLIGLSAWGIKAWSQTLSGSPDSVHITIGGLARDPAYSKRVVTLNIVTQVQHLYETISALPPTPHNVACPSTGEYPYTLAFQQGTETLATVVADRFGCGSISIAGKVTNRQPTGDFWSELDRAIYQATPVARPKQLALLHTLRLDQIPQAGQITSIETVQRLYDAILALPQHKNGNCSPESLHEYQLVFHTTDQAIFSVIDKACNTISLEGNYLPHGGNFVMNDQFKQLFRQTLAMTPFALAQPDQLTLDIEPLLGTDRWGLIADASLKQQLYTKIFALSAGKAPSNCPVAEDKAARKGKWYMLSFRQWDLPVVNVDAYQGSCTLISLDTSRNMNMSRDHVLQSDHEFWDLVHRLENGSTH